MSTMTWVILGWVLLALAGAWVLLCLIRWRSKRRRCPKCSYDLSGAEPMSPQGVLCTECGRVAFNEKELRRRRRRPFTALLALAPLLLGSQMVMFPLRPDRGWTRWVPTSALVWSAGKFDFGPCFETGGARPWMHLALLQRAEGMWNWQRRTWLPHAAAPTSGDVEQRLTGRMIWPRGVAVRSEFRAWTTEYTPSFGAVEVPISAKDIPPLPSGEGFYRLNARSLKASSTSVPVADFAAVVNPRAESPQLLVKSFAHLSFFPSPGFPKPLMDAINAAATRNTGIEVGTDLLGRTFVSGRVPLMRTRLHLPITRVDNIDDVITPVPSQHAETAVVASTRFVARKNGILVMFDGLSAWPRGIPTMLRIEVLRDGAVVGTITSAGNWAYLDFAECKSSSRRWLRDIVQGGAGGESDWAIRFSGDAEETLRWTLSDVYWCGSIEIPLTPDRVEH